MLDRARIVQMKAHPKNFNAESTASGVFIFWLVNLKRVLIPEWQRFRRVIILHN